jgi:outer membrane protein OmpA-like peptidoglycan-associated protein
MGSPINSDKNEMGLIVNLDGKTAIYAAEFGDTRGGTDLYTFELPEKLRAEAATYVKATVTDAETKNVLKGVVVKLREVGKTNVLTEIKTDEVGEFLLCLPKGKNYDLSVSEKGYLFYSDNFELTDKNTVNTPQILNIVLQKIPVMAANSTTTAAVPVTNKAIILKNVFFETGSAALKSASLEELNRLRDLLKENMDLKIQISGHTDNQGSDAMNMTLSENRAKAVKEYLIGQGINSSRLSSKGFGKTQPIDTNDTEAGRKNNRRTEFIVHSN